MTIYFDINAEAYAFEIPDYVCTTTDELWSEVSGDPSAWKIQDGQFIDLRETETYKAKKLAEAKEIKYNEAKSKAYYYLDSGEALYEFEEGKHVEATDGNIAKFTAYALGFASGSVTPVAWCTKEDETVFLNQEQVVDILQGLGAVQAQVWTVKFINYVQQIEEASTIEEVKAINIDYSQEVEPISVPEEDPVEQETEVFEDIQDIISNNGEEE